MRVARASPKDSLTERDYGHEIQMLKKEIEMLKEEIKKLKENPSKVALKPSMSSEKPPNFESDIWRAAEEGNISSVKYLVEQEHVNPDKPLKKIYLSSYGCPYYQIQTPLHFAATSDHLDVVKYLIEECHCNVEAKDNKGKTPLYIALDRGCLDIVKYFIEKLHYNPETYEGTTPLRIAYCNGNLDVVIYLVEECHAKFTDEDKKRISDTLTSMDKYKESKTPKYAKICEIYEYFITRRTPLHTALIKGDLKTAKQILKDSNYN